MTKSELTQQLADHFNIPLKHARLVVDAIFDSMTDALANGEKVIMRGFGSFGVKKSNERMGRNPQTGEIIHVNSRKSVSFKTGRGLHERLNPHD